MTLKGIKSASLFIALTLVCIGFVHTALPDPFSITFESLGELTIETSWYFGYASVNEIGYFFGKVEGGGPNQNIRFNFTTGTWTIFPDLPTTLSFPCVVPVPNGDIYIIGGGLMWSADFGPNATVYKLAAGSDSYQMMTPMHFARYFHSCTYDADTHRIYVFGGAGKLAQTAIVTGEYYSIDDDTWTMTANRSDRGYAAVNVGDGHIYTLNGLSTTDVRRYSIADDTWTTIGSMNIASSEQIAAYYEPENIIFLFGGPSMDSGCEYFNLTSLAAVSFPCGNSLNISLNPWAKIGTFIPASNTFYMHSYGHLWTANFTPIEPTPDSSPVTSNAPTTPGAPVANNSPSVTPSTSRPPSDVITSAAVCSTGAVGLISTAMIVALLV